MKSKELAFIAGLTLYHHYQCHFYRISADNNVEAAEKFFNSTNKISGLSQFLERKIMQSHFLKNIFCIVRDMFKYV